MELTLVVSLIGVMAALAVPDFIAYRRRAQSTEARALLELVAHLEAVRRLETGKYVACPKVPAEVPRGHPEKFVATPEWQQLGFGIEGGTRYQLEVELVGSGFIARARGDLDGDGRVSTFTRDPIGRETETEPLE